MTSNFTPLNIDKIKQAVSCGKISYFDSIDSTNSYLLEQGECSDICISKMQTSGRGRRGNHWASPQTGNIYFSQYWCFEKISEYWTLLGLMTGIATAEALHDVGLTGHGIKWPNDIYWQGKKLGGILLETRNQSGNIIIGIGLNVMMPEALSAQIDQSISSMESAMQGKPFSHDQLVIALINRLQEIFNNFDRFNFDHFIKKWKKWDILHDEIISFEHQGTRVTGKTVGIDMNGRLGVIQASGQCQYYSSADICLTRKEVKDDRI